MIEIPKYKAQILNSSEWCEGYAVRRADGSVIIFITDYAYWEVEMDSLQLLE